MSKFPTLAYNESTGAHNFPEWRARVAEHMRSRYITVASVFWRNELVEPAMPSQSESERKRDPAKYDAEIRIYIQEKKEFKDQKALCLGELLVVLPELYKNKLYANEKWTSWSNSDDLLEVWRFITQLATQPNPSAALMNKVELKKQFQNLHQTSAESLEAFEDRVRRFSERMKTAGIPPVEEGELIIAFLNGIDTKHAEAASVAMNRIQCDGMEALPTLTATKDFVIRYKSILGKMSTLNVSTHEDQPTKRRGNDAERSVKTYSKSSTAQPQPNFKSSRVQHQTEPSSKFEKRKPRCQTCLALGYEFNHDFKKCTFALEMRKKADKLEATTQTKPSKVLQVMQEDLTSAALCVRLDTQADIHIFNTAELLKNVKSTEPISFKGYGDATHVVNEVGTYNGIKDVYLDRSRNSSVNLLSYARIVDDFGCTAQYCQKSDTFIVQTPESTMRFARAGNHYESCGQSAQEVMNVESETSTVQSREAGYKKSELQRF